MLAVEDEGAILELARESLEQLVYTVFTAGSLEEAMRRSEEQAGLKCLYMSGYTADVIAHRGVLEPGIAFLQKPFAPTALLRKVREILNITSPPTI